MKGSKILSAVFGVLGILLMVATAAVSIASRNAQPVPKTGKLPALPPHNRYPLRSR